jgi:hypothetical protein
MFTASRFVVSADRAEDVGFSAGDGELVARSPDHPRLENRVADTEDLGDAGRDAVDHGVFGSVLISGDAAS